MTSWIHPVNRGTLGDARNIAALLSDAFELDPVSRWLLSEPEERRRRHMRFFLVFVEYALRRQAVYQGEVRLEFDGQGYGGAALWLRRGSAEEDAGPEMARIEDALGPDAFERFMALDDLMRRHHPSDVSHEYLPFIGVISQRQGDGLGRRLLETRLAELDEEGIPAYLEASNERSCHLYRRNGFLPLGSDIWLPNGPPLHPMWREPKRQRQSENDGRWS